MQKMWLTFVLLAAIWGSDAWAARSVLPPDVPKAGTATNLPVIWQNNLKDALALAGTQYEPVMILFSSPDCQWCTRMKEDVFTDPGVSDMLQHFVLVEIDVTKDENTAELYQVRGVPTVLILSADGEIKTGVGGYLNATEFLKMLRGGLNPEFLKTKEASYLSLLKLLDEGNVPTNRWADIMIELSSPDRRKDLHARILNLTPFPRQAIVDLLQDPRLAVRLGAMEIIEEVCSDISGYDPWLDETLVESNKVALARLQAWAGGTNAQPAAITSVYSALTREQVSSYIRDLMSEDRDRSVRALRMLEHGGPNVFTVLAEFLQANPDLPAGKRNRIKEVQYMLSIEGCGGLDGAVVAHRLLFGNLDVRLKAIGDLRNAGVYAIPILREFLLDRDPIVRETAADTLLTAGGPKAVPLLKEHLAGEKDKDVVFCVLNGLGNVRNRTGMDILASYLNHPNEDLAVAALHSIAKLKSATAQKETAACLADPRWRVRVAALEAVGALKLSHLETTVTDMLKDKDPFVRYTAIKTLTAISAKKAAPKLEEAFLREDELKGPVVAAYGSLDMALPDSFAKAMDGKSPDVVLSVIEALKDCGEKDLKLVDRYMDDSNLDLACAATRLIASKGMKNAKYRARIVAVLQKGRREQVLAVLESLRFENRSRSPIDFGEGLEDEDAAAVLSPKASDGVLDALLGAFMEGVADPAAKPPAQPEKAPISAPGTTNALTVPKTSPEDDIFAAFMEATPGGSGTQAVAGAAAATGTAARVEAASAPDDVIHAVEAIMDGSSDDTVKFRAALLLTKLGTTRGLPVLGSGLAARTQADRMSVAEHLGAAPARQALPLLQLLLQDPSEEIRGQAASMCLNKSDGTVFLEAVLNDLARPDSRLKPYDVSLSSFDSVARQPAGRRVAGDWARRMLAEKKDPALENFALVVLESCWKSADAQLVASRLHSSDPLQRRAALHSLGRGDPQAFTNELGWASEDPSELVRAVIPNLYMRDSSRWLDYLDATHFDNERYIYGGYSYGSYGRETKLSRPVRNALNKLTEDDSPNIRVEAYFCLLSNQEPVDLAKFIKTCESFPDQQVIGERIADYLAYNYEKLGPGFRLLIPYLEKSRREDTYLDKVRKHFKVDPTKAQENFAVITRGADMAPAAATYLDATPSAGKPVHKLVYFTLPGCQGCEQVQQLLAALRQDFPDLDVEAFNIRKLSAMNLNEALCEKFRVPENSRLIAPAVFGGGGYLIKRDITDAGLHELLIRSERIPLKDWYDIPPETLDKAGTAIARRYSAMGLGVVALAGLLDGINPCAFATIIFLLSYLQITRRAPRQILQIGATFILGVFLTYLAMGFGLIGIVVKAQATLRWVRQALNWGLAAFSLVIMILSIRDGILCLRGRLEDITLQLPGMLKAGIHGVIRRGSRHAHFVIAAFVIGVAISVLELACTGQVYLPTIGYMLNKGGNAGGASGYLFLYNVMFIAPLVAIFVIASFGMTSDALTRFLQKHAALVKFATAVLFLLLFLFFVFGNLWPVTPVPAAP